MDDRQDNRTPAGEEGDAALLRETERLLVERFNARLRDEAPLDAREIKSLTESLLDLRSQLDAPRTRTEPLTVRFVDLDGAEE